MSFFIVVLLIFIYTCVYQSIIILLYILNLCKKKYFNTTVANKNPESSPPSGLTAHTVSLRNVSLPQLWAKTNRIKIKYIQGTNCHSFHLTVVCLINNQVTAFSMLLDDRKTLWCCATCSILNQLALWTLSSGFKLLWTCVCMAAYVCVLEGRWESGQQKSWKKKKHSLC